MQIKKLKVGNIVTDNNIFLAPLAGYTDYAFRHQALKLGYGLCFTELVSSKGVCYHSAGNGEILCGDGDYNKTVAQLFGSDPYYMRKACESEDLKNYSVVDINMGCPEPKIFKNGDGSALLKDIKKAESIVKECVKSGKTITVKIRSGIKEGDDLASDFCKMAEDSGAVLVTVHGRVRERFFSGEPDYNSIEKAKKGLSIPVIANGGIFTLEDANKMMDRTGADGVMLARGAIENPFLVCEILGRENPFTLKEFIRGQLTLMREKKGDKRSAVEFRKFVNYYFKGQFGFKEFRLELMNKESVDDLLNLIEERIK